MKGRNLWLVIGGVAVAVAVVVVLIIVSASGGSGGKDVKGADEVLTALKGVPQSGTRLGAPDAKVVITEFGDLQCPACAQASTELVPEIVDKLVRPGTAALEFRPLAFIGPQSVGGALAAAAAAEQGKAWPFVEIAYRNQGAENSGWLSDDLITSIAKAIPGMDVSAFDTYRQGTDATAAVEAAQREADRVPVSSTPTFVVTGPGGTKTVVGAVGFDEIQQAVKAVQG